ncbi:Gfo/Idh/MocA family protein [Dinghuibacter silviterrae]|uniref:Putative dehydrogenase n=1 Tax=Dinghuibacter silviterrae TaxID=1539049 RepID=A0A4R8DSH9_9BACT|nr:Gfo/Idh/MocA family oxidoreductase [Dinghuibacter silviterrae]TDX00808.1 putative dehydrogenase [Dinghuibacter silviterrae]
MQRKKFLTTSAGLIAGAALGPAALLAPSDRLNIAAIGINGMGWADLTGALKDPSVRCVALCDVDRNVLDKRAASLAATGKVDTYGDYRKILDRKDIDAVIIGTPDHWHCLIMTDACAAGKDVYVEKPAGNSIVECAAMVGARDRYHRIVQVGQWQRSQKHFADAVAFVRTGRLGKIRLVKAWAYQGWMHSIPKQPDGAAPPGVDYTQWLGPAETRPFNPNRFHFNFRWFWDYAGGLMTDWGVHLLDYALLGMDAGDPKSIMASGGKFAYPDDAAETPDTLTTVYEYEGFNIQWEHAVGIDGGPYNRNHGIAFIGNNGTLVLDRQGWEVIPEHDQKTPRMDAVALQSVVDNGVDLHTANFLEAVRTRNGAALKAPIEAGAHVATVAQMGNIAYKTGKKLFWDTTNRRFTDEAANRYLAAAYHNGYTIPKYFS